MSVSLVGVTLHVAHVERSLEFYRKVPGATTIFHLPGKFALLGIGDGRLGLLKDSARAFHVEIDCRDLDAACADLRERGFDIDGPTMRPWGMRDAQLIDPDGNLVEFGQAR